MTTRSRCNTSGDGIAPLGRASATLSHQGYRTPEFGVQDIFPESRLSALLSTEQIKKAVSNLVLKHDVAEITSEVWSHRRKFVAILVEIKLVPRITALVSRGLAEASRLPSAHLVPQKLVLGKPYVFFGPANSRLDEMLLFSEGPPQPCSSYQSPQHPEYRAGLSFYSHGYDYYGLGHIGFCAHLDDIMENCRGEKHDFLLQKKILLLGASMASRYQGVVQRCLGSDFVESSGIHGPKIEEREIGSEEMQVRFGQLVVGTLSELAGFDV